MASNQFTLYHILVYVATDLSPIITLMMQTILVGEDMDNDQLSGTENPEVLLGLRVLARIIAAVHLAQTAAQAEKFPESEEADEGHS